MIRQPILCVLGHIDHGKTSLLDYMRGTTVADREVGKITQHIGATEIPIDKVYEICGSLIPRGRLEMPGLLFIDTPGHRAFASLRERGGALADLAILVIDINEGVMNETRRSIDILKSHKTPFVIAANKIDRINGWKTAQGPFSYRKQGLDARENFDKKFYRLIEQLYVSDIPSDRYDNIGDFRKSFAIVPISAISGEGIPDLLATVVGIAQRFLKDELEIRSDRGEGSVLEVKEEKSIGLTLNVILYDGILKEGDKIAISNFRDPLKTRVKALFLPNSLSEMRDRKTRYRKVKAVSAACGVKVVPQEVRGVIISGVPFRAYDSEDELGDMRLDVDLSLDNEGVIIKADAMGSLEAVIYELKQPGYRARKAEIGDVSRRDVIECASSMSEKERVILAFNVRVLEEAGEEAHKQGVRIMESSLVYDVVERYDLFCQEVDRREKESKMACINMPGSVEILPGCVFRMSKPAIVGVRIVSGVISPKTKLINKEGKVVGRISSIQTSGKTLHEVSKGDEVALAIEGGVVGRNLEEGSVLYTDIDEGSARVLSKLADLPEDTKELLLTIIEIKKRNNSLWAS